VNADLSLSIFKWYGGDFEKKLGSVLKVLQPYWLDKERVAADAGNFKVRYTVYDWSLNEQGK
jgi:hypothetical protein